MMSSSSGQKSPRAKKVQQPSTEDSGVETIGFESEESKPRRKVNAGGKKKIRKKRGPDPMTVQQEIASWHNKLKDAENDAMVAQIEEILAKLAEKEPGLVANSAVQSLR